jgi:hypothetical protein
VDTHGAAQQAAFTSLLGFVDGMLHHDRWWGSRRLGFVPVGFGLIQLGWQCFLEPPFADSDFEFTLPAGRAETDQTFFALTRRKIWKTSWMILLLLRGLSAISSLAAATTIQNAGWDRNSMAANRCCV